MNTWRPKLANDGIVLLHHTSVRHSGFGVWKLFSELQQQYPTYEFLHGHGLGVVALGEVPPRLVWLFDNSDQIKDFLHLAYSTLGRAMTQRWELAVLHQREQGYQEELSHVAAEAIVLRDELTRQRSVIKEAQLLATRLEEQLASKLAFSNDAEAAALGSARESPALQTGNIRCPAGIASRAGEVARVQREQARLIGSLSWRLTGILRRPYAQNPRSMQIGLSMARCGWWLVTLRLGRIVSGLRIRRQLWREEAVLAADPMFDAEYYRQRHMENMSPALSPMRHYLLFGRYEMRSPHPLFDTTWYSEMTPEVKAEGVDPLLHYIRLGRAKGHKPNPLFDPAWYLRRNKDVAASGIDPVQHFMQRGAAEGRDPSPEFKTRWYLEHYPDVALSGVNPLEHFLHRGRLEGREANAFEVDFSTAKPATTAKIECRKRPILRREAALFMTHSPNGKLKSHVRYYLESLAREDIGITLIVAADRGFTDDEPWLYELVDGLYVRENDGWDFAGWAHVLRLNRHLFGGEILYWLNDSLIGPVTQEAFHLLLERVRGNPAAVVGLTANHERGRHLQSYFLAIKRQALESLAFQGFVFDVKCLPNKNDVINAYEIRFSPRLEAANLPTAALFEPNPMHNPTLYNWKELLEGGFAFLKVLAITNDLRDVDKSDWREVLHRHGYNVLLADRLLAEQEDPPMQSMALT